jgi:hypothetical protein
VERSRKDTEMIMTMQASKECRQQIFVAMIERLVGRDAQPSSDQDHTPEESDENHKFSL